VILSAPSGLVELAVVELLIHIVFVNTRDCRVRQCNVCHAVDTGEVLHLAPFVRCPPPERFMRTASRHRLGSHNNGVTGVHQKLHDDHLVKRLHYGLVRRPGDLGNWRWFFLDNHCSKRCSAGKAHGVIAPPLLYLQDSGFDVPGLSGWRGFSHRARGSGHSD
jgi:hypothetical protein